MPEAGSFESRRHGGLFQHGGIALLGFGWRDVADRLQKPPIIEPIHQALGRLDRDVLHGTIGMMDETATADRTPIVQGLLERMPNFSLQEGVAACSVG